MTQEEAIRAARDFMIQQKHEVILDPIAVRRMEAGRFNELFDCQLYPSDFWAIEFLKILPPSVAAETPGSIIVEVIDITRQVREVYVGMWADLMEQSQ